MCLKEIVIVALECRIDLSRLCVVALDENSKIKNFSNMNQNREIRTPPP